jgi:carbonic anhydrase/acetyltransferase-like protein (isoleucine patch superfamily)
MWSGNHIGHHSIIHDNVFIASHAVVSGSVEVGENSFLGVNATIVNDVTIGADNWIGPHVVITRDTEPDSTWRPARSERRSEPTRQLFGVSE